MVSATHLLVIPCFLLSCVHAVPFKRYDNSSSFSSIPSITASASTSATLADFDPDESSSGAYYNSTSTVYEYQTVTLPSTTLTIPETATSQLSVLSSYMDDSISTSTMYVTRYQTLTSDGVTTTKPVGTETSEAIVYSRPTEGNNEEDNEDNEEDVEITSTVFKTITQDDTSSSDDSCGKETVTVTVTDTPSPSPFTRTTSYPVTAEFTMDESTSTLTTFIQVTETLDATSTTSDSMVTSESVASSSAPYANTTISTLTPGNSTNFRRDFGLGYYY